MRYELVRLAGTIDWDWIDAELGALFSDQRRPDTDSRFMIGLLLLKHIYGLSDEGVCERWVYDPYFQHFTGRRHVNDWQAHETAVSFPVKLRPPRFAMRSWPRLGTGEASCAR
jgi:IS5 family transposase